MCARVAGPPQQALTLRPPQWDLVCDAAYRARGSQSVFMTGLMVAAPLMGPLADRLGRRRTLAGCCLALVACLGGSMAAPSHDVFVLLRSAAARCGGSVSRRDRDKSPQVVRVHYKMILSSVVC